MREKNQSQHDEQDIEGTVEESENRVVTEENQSQHEEQEIEGAVKKCKKGPPAKGLLALKKQARDNSGSVTGFFMC